MQPTYRGDGTPERTGSFSLLKLSLRLSRDQRACRSDDF